MHLVHGSFTVITGRIGSGKTTLPRVLLGLLPKDAGEILWNGEHVTDPATFFKAPRSAYAAQLLIKLVGVAIEVLDGSKVFMDTMLEYLYLSRRAVLLPCRYVDIDYTLPLSSYNPLDEGIKRGINSVRT